ncbi:MAG: hypothetical protein SLRJCFUN_001344 [Candidatus Fervidibacter sp.]
MRLFRLAPTEGVRKLSPANFSVRTSSPSLERLGDFHKVGESRRYSSAKGKLVPHG